VKVAVWLAVLTACLGYVRAAAGAGVSLSLADCPGLDEQVLREHLELELVTLRLEHAEASLQVRCADGSANIALTGQQGSYPIQVRVELRDTAKAARERLVALAATELLAQAERALSGVAGHSRAGEAAPSPLPRAGDAPDSTASTRAPKHRPVELFVAGSVALVGTPTTTLYGGSLGTLLGLSRYWALLFDTRFDRGAAELTSASVRWSVLSGFAGPTFQVEASNLRIAAGLGLRAGWLALDASASTPYEGLSLTAPWAGGALPLRLSTELAGLLVPFVSVEAGYVLVPVKGNIERRINGGSAWDGALVEQRGAWFCGSVGVGVRL
jgi:hypothetical protein